MARQTGRNRKERQTANRNEISPNLFWFSRCNELPSSIQRGCKLIGLFLMFIAAIPVWKRKVIESWDRFLIRLSFNYSMQRSSTNSILILISLVHILQVPISSTIKVRWHSHHYVPLVCSTFQRILRFVDDWQGNNSKY